MNKIVFSTSIAALLLLAVTAGAQRSRQAADPLKERSGNYSSLLARSDVQKDLKVTKEQKAKIDELQKGLAAAFENGGGDESARSSILAQVAQHDQKAVAILTKDQQARLVQISLWMSVSQALTRRSTRAALSITRDQITQLRAVQTASRGERQKLFEAQAKSKDEDKSIAKQLQANQQKLDADMLAVLTKEQRTKFDKLRGKKFTPDPSKLNGLRFGGRGGRGGGG